MMINTTRLSQEIQKVKNRPKKDPEIGFSVFQKIIKIFGPLNKNVIIILKRQVPFLFVILVWLL